VLSKLIPFQKSHFQTLINWIKDEETMLNFAGTGFQYPLTEQQLIEYINKYPKRLLFLGLDNKSNPVAYGEVIPQKNNSARLGHLIIGVSQNRGKGLGKQLIQLLIIKAKKHIDITRMDLFLLEGNLPAQNCYLNYGFQFAPNDFVIAFKNKSYNILKMTIAV
jgi:RimJ/RimL family protein N-acetyltransferase